MRTFALHLLSRIIDHLRSKIKQGTSVFPQIIIGVCLHLLVFVVVVFVLTTSLRPFANLETRGGLETKRAPQLFSGIVIRDAKVSYWSILFSFVPSISLRSFCER